MSQLSVSHLSFSYDTSAQPIFSDVSFEINTDWKLGFIGRNGRGKTTFLNLLLGKYPYSGSFPLNISPIARKTLPYACWTSSRTPSPRFACGNRR